ncbi:hypothetical protein NQ318_016461 [Aromia moschata]|uniref:Uncharacterized protein n=1 Tax=Aromia moschata TaxID=1265417 RepID=A0AAV8Z5P9_9CUCU|nr:hypothetical protein NQ318_016461 [Aromia moschata]
MWPVRLLIRLRFVGLELVGLGFVSLEFVGSGFVGLGFVDLRVPLPNLSKTLGLIRVGMPSVGQFIISKRFQ